MWELMGSGKEIYTCRQISHLRPFSKAYLRVHTSTRRASQHLNMRAPQYLDGCSVVSPEVGTANTDDCNFPQSKKETFFSLPSPLLLPQIQKSYKEGEEVSGSQTLVCPHLKLTEPQLQPKLREDTKSEFCIPDHWKWLNGHRIRPRSLKEPLHNRREEFNRAQRRDGGKQTRSRDGRCRREGGITNGARSSRKLNELESIELRWSQQSLDLNRGNKFHPPRMEEKLLRRV